MSKEVNSKSFELLYQSFIKNKHLLGKVVANRMNTHFKDVAKVLDIFKAYIEFLENENAKLSTEKKSNESRTTKTKKSDTSSIS